MSVQEGILTKKELSNYNRLLNKLINISKEKQNITNQLNDFISEKIAEHITKISWVYVDPFTIAPKYIKDDIQLFTLIKALYHEINEFNKETLYLVSNNCFYKLTFCANKTRIHFSTKNYHEEFAIKINLNIDLKQVMINKLKDSISSKEKEIERLQRELDIQKQKLSESESNDL